MKTILTVIALLTLFSCSAATLDITDSGIGGPQLPPQSASLEPFKMDFKPVIKFPQVEDRRIKPVAGFYNSAPVQSQSNFALIADFGLKKALRRRGFSFSEQAPVTLNAVINDWSFVINGSDLESTCAIKLEASDPAGHVVFSRIYKDIDRVKTHGIEPGEIEQSMGRAMGNILGEISSDKELLLILSAY